MKNNTDTYPYGSLEISEHEGAATKNEIVDVLLSKYSIMEK